MSTVELAQAKPPGPTVRARREGTGSWPLPDRIAYWLSVGATPSEHVSAFLKKYMAKWEQKEAEAAAPKTVPAEAAPTEPAAPPA